MSDTNNRPLKDASLRGDTKAMPDRGTATGMDPGAPIWSVENADINFDVDATNRLGSVNGKSDAWDHDAPSDPALADAGSFGYTHDHGLPSMGGTDSDPVGKTKASPSKA